LNDSADEADDLRMLVRSNEKVRVAIERYEFAHKVAHFPR